MGSAFLYLKILGYFNKFEADNFLNEQRYELRWGFRNLQAEQGDLSWFQYSASYFASIFTSLL